MLVLAIASAAVASALSRPVAGAPCGSLAVPVVGGLALAIAVASLGHISDATSTPAVTLGPAVNRHFPWACAPGYVIAQFAGAIAAAAATWGLYGNQARSIARLGATVPAAGVSPGRGARGRSRGHLRAVSGGGINPARAIRPMILAGRFSDWWAYSPRLLSAETGTMPGSDWRQLAACRQQVNDAPFAG